jgi:serine/threonine-protein kinase
MALDRLEQLFQAALLHPPPEREAFIRAACPDDPTLCAELLSLLQADLEAEQDPDLLQQPLPELQEAFEPADEQDDPRQVGPYVLIRRLGRGGMGTVHLARRERPFKQYVALKLIHASLDAEPALLRFDMERQILASLNHPNIARLLDGGVTDDGLPYFAMEYVEGLPLTQYCDQHRLAIEDRLRLFQRVCHAVHYAHQNLVLHRDLKPSNILVTQQQVVKLLDYGIAKLLNPALSPVEMPVTMTGMQVLTPEYASPEQVRGEVLTTASDVYSLGVILYELLTGHRPYRLAKHSPLEMLQLVCEQPVVRPSTMASQIETLEQPDGSRLKITPETVSQARAAGTGERLRRRLRGDLDNIVLMALRKEATRRYGSAEQLGQDIEHFLTGEPVEAHRDTRWYRIRKFVRRNAIETVAALSVVVSLMLGMGGAFWQASEARLERDRASDALLQAEQALTQSGAVTTFLMGLFEASDPRQALGEAITARVLLERGIERAEQLSDQPIVQSALLRVVGRVYFSLGQYAKARPVLERALAIRRDLHGGAHADVTESLNDLGELLHRSGSYLEARKYYKEALELQRALLDPNDPAIARTLTNLGTLLFDAAEYQVGEPYLREALELRTQNLGPEDPRTLLTLDRLGELLYQRGDFSAADSILQQGTGEPPSGRDRGTAPALRRRPGRIRRPWRRGRTRGRRPGRPAR